MLSIRRVLQQHNETTRLAQKQTPTHIISSAAVGLGLLLIAAMTPHVWYNSEESESW